MKKQNKTDDVTIINKKTLFDHIKHIIEIQDPNYFKKLSDGDKKSWSNYMIQRFLSMNPEWTEFISEMDPIIISNQLNPELAYQLYISIIPKSNTYLKYIKSSNSTSYPDRIVDLMKINLEISKSDCIEYLNILSAIDANNEYITELLINYGTPEKEINKILDSLNKSKMKV